MITVTDNDIGRLVVYKVYTINKDGTKTVFIKEEGIITDYNKNYVFVRYSGDKYSKATSYHDLEYIYPAFR